MGHFRDTLIAVCSTPSSPLGPGVPGMVPLLKFRFTISNREKHLSGDRKHAEAVTRSPAQSPHRRGDGVLCQGPRVAQARRQGRDTHSW